MYQMSGLVSLLLCWSSTVVFFSPRNHLFAFPPLVIVCCYFSFLNHFVPFLYYFCSFFRLCSFFLQFLFLCYCFFPFRIILSIVSISPFVIVYCYVSYRNRLFLFFLWLSSFFFSLPPTSIVIVFCFYFSYYNCLSLLSPLVTAY